ncbi:MAG: penicillin-binding transpeptidase domain-containing protein [Cytophagales bacterium]|nr:penicillin-binding transpeptidase domain-containing protein [Cytophagales bacterium]
MNERGLAIRGIIILIILILVVRLFSIQVGNEEYKLAAQNNIMQKRIEYPYRGLIHDRNGELIAYNAPIYNLIMVPRDFDKKDSLKVIQMLGLEEGEFKSQYEKCVDFSYSKPSPFEEEIPPEQFAQIQDELSSIKGLSIETRINRAYAIQTLGNTLGYVGEISAARLAADTADYYRGGDYIGISGLEREYEHVLRGKRGVSYKMVNVRGIVEGDFSEGQFDTIPEPGQDLEITIDLELQQYAEYLMAGKVGSVVAIEPSSGEILAFVSSPNYDPSLLTGRDFSKNFVSIKQDSLNPLFNRPVQAMYPPGSMFKTVQSLIALQEKATYPKEQIYSDNTLIGDLAPTGYYDIPKAIQFSSNNYFYKVFRRLIQRGEHESAFIDSRIGLESWGEYVKKFGLGVRLGLDLPGEVSGSVPNIDVYDRIYGRNRWKFSNIYSLSIGQGELLVTPIQMANLGAILANRGYYYTPHFIKKIGADSLVVAERNELGIEAQHYEPVITGMERVIQAGSGIRAFISDIAICGKTSTVQNAGEDHSGFMGFAPKENPQIAIAVYVENAGQGGRAAAGTASLLIEKHVRGEITRPWLEDFILKGEFIF